MKKYITVFFLLGVIGVLIFSVSNKKVEKKVTHISSTPITSTPAIVSYLATFAIFTNGTFRLFNDEKYHKKSLDVFIEKENVNKIIVKKSGVTWGDFFKPLPMSLKKECLITGTGHEFCNTATYTLKFYINGIKDDNALEKQIEENDQLLVSYGPKNEEIRSQLEKLSTIK